MELVKMSELDRLDWEKFKASSNNTLSIEEVKIVSELHAKYYKHPYHIPCSCNPKTMVKWIKELNTIYDNE